MLTTKKQIPTTLPFPDKEDIKPSELNFYHYLIIIGLQNYCFYLNWQRF